MSDTFDAPTFLERVVGVLPVAVQPYAKAVVPVVLAAVIAGQDLVFDLAEVNELKTLAIGAVTAALVATFPNVE